MKLSKTLLSAIVVGIAAQTAPSCTKTAVKSGQKTELQPAGRPTVNPVKYYSDFCPACGMG